MPLHGESFCKHQLSGVMLTFISLALEDRKRLQLAESASSTMVAVSGLWPGREDSQCPVSDSIIEYVPLGQDLSLQLSVVYFQLRFINIQNMVKGSSQQTNDKQQPVDQTSPEMYVV